MGLHKIPQEMVELQFLGLNFMVTRLILTIILVSVMGFFIVAVDRKKPTFVGYRG